MTMPKYRNAKPAAVIHNASNRRFEIKIDDHLSVLEYTFKNHRLFLTHTEVPPDLQDQGLGSKLAHAALEYARQNNLSVVAICPFVQEYVNSHPEYQSFVTTSGA
jgi:predicted GNAT family acetyltransferase